MSLLVVLVATVAWNPYEPSQYHKPSDKCVGQFVDWVKASSRSYGFCGSNESTVQSVVTIKPETELSDCIDICFKVTTVSVGDRWLAAEWADGVCTCRGVVNGSTFEQLDTTLIRFEDEGCDSTVIWVPLSCMWTAETPCIKAPGAPDGCIWTRESCCVDAMGYVAPPLIFWPLRWWMWAGSGIFIFVFSAALIFTHLHPSRPPDMHRPPDDPGVEEALRDSHKKSYTKRLKSLSINMSSTVDDGCCICLEDLKENCEAVELRCSHVYHYKCMHEYVMHQVQRGIMYPRCPTCRVRILVSDDEASMEGEGGIGEGREEEEEPLEQEMLEITHPHSSSGESQHELLAESPIFSQRSSISLTINEAERPGNTGTSEGAGVV